MESSISSQPKEVIACPHLGVDLLFFIVLQDRENIERLEITGVGDPSGRGLGFSYVRTAPKAPISNALTKKKTAVSRGSSTVTGTDADLRRLSMEAAREVCLFLFSF